MSSSPCAPGDAHTPPILSAIEAVRWRWRLPDEGWGAIFERIEAVFAVLGLPSFLDRLPCDGAWYRQTTAGSPARSAWASRPSPPCSLERRRAVFDDDPRPPPGREGAWWPGSRRNSRHDGEEGVVAGACGTRDREPAKLRMLRARTSCRRRESKTFLALLGSVSRYPRQYIAVLAAVGGFR